MEAERLLLTGLVALDVFDQYVFPHQQLQRDATRMQLAVNALEAGDPALANDTYIRRTGLTNAGRLFAYESYVAELARHEPSGIAFSGVVRLTCTPMSTCGRSTTQSPTRSAPGRRMPRTTPLRSPRSGANSAPFTTS